ncbi:hypothetical protein B0H11DRAFT_447029 [Mycena galericulata]|nr:hypothetical protein B0H11DRAFT_447029 [Mycena galericulata]
MLRARRTRTPSTRPLYRPSATPLARVLLLDLKPFNPTDKRTEITYREESTGKFKLVTKDMTGSIIELCSRNRTKELEGKLEQDVEGYATRCLHALAVAYEELNGHDHEAEGNGFELIELLAIFDPPRGCEADD